MKQLKSETGTFDVQKHLKNFTGTEPSGRFSGTIYWADDMGKIIEAIGIWEGSKEGVNVRDLHVDEMSSGNGKIYSLFY